MGTSRGTVASAENVPVFLKGGGAGSAANGKKRSQISTLLLEFVLSTVKTADPPVGDETSAS